MRPVVHLDLLLCVLQHLHEVLTATEAGRDSDINNSVENIMPRVKLIDASLKVSKVYIML